jgi:hypothetical protein
MRTVNLVRPEGPKGRRLEAKCMKPKLKSTNNWGKYGITDKIYNDWWLDLQAASKKGFKTTREKARGRQRMRPEGAKRFWAFFSPTFDKGFDLSYRNTLPCPKGQK